MTCIWDNEPAPFLGQVGGKPGYYVELGVKRTITKGIDDFRVQYDPVNQVNGTTQVSYRIYTVAFRVVSYDKDIPAFDIMDQIRRGLRSLMARQEYVDTGIAFVDWGATSDVVNDRDNSSATESILEVKIAWNVAADPGDDTGGVILGVGSKVAASPSDIGNTPSLS